MLAQEIESVRRRELVAALNAGEAQVAAEVRAKLPTHIELGDDVRLRLQHFVQWCGRHSVRACAAKPTTVAAWVLDHAGLGADSVMETLAAIETLHNYHGLSLPTKSAVVCKALESAFKAEPPRSWPAADKLLFATLPEAIKQTIGRRERDRERELRRAQNIAAELKKQLKATEKESVNV